jgi:limonene-1,2-epoxide hydrolase
MAQSPSDLVTAFVKEWDAPAPTAETIAAYFTDDALYHNIPMQPITGAVNIGKALGAMSGQMKSAGWQVLNQTATGDVVMNERVDRFTMGEKTVAVRVAGVFEVKDGKIAAWRDYFDLAEFQNQMK